MVLHLLERQVVWHRRIRILFQAACIPSMFALDVSSSPPHSSLLPLFSADDFETTETLLGAAKVRQLQLQKGEPEDSSRKSSASQHRSGDKGGRRTKYERDAAAPGLHLFSDDDFNFDSDISAASQGGDDDDSHDD